VFAEALTLIRYRLGHAAALRSGRSLQQLAGSGVVEYVRVDDSHDAVAWHIFERYADQTFSYTDCSSFAVMRALDLRRAFTADRHFATLGFELVP
jgi:predicted nucleic acid-binding protein